MYVLNPTYEITGAVLAVYASGVQCAGGLVDLTNRPSPSLCVDFRVSLFLLRVGYFILVSWLLVVCTGGRSRQH